MEKYIGKVILVHLPGMKRPQYRWIVRKREDGRFIIRVPKSGVFDSLMKIQVYYLSNSYLQDIFTDHENGQLKISKEIPIMKLI